MAVDLPETTYAVLGLVDKVPGASGYDLVSVAGRSFAHFWPISQTLLYRELRRLADLGWVSATRVEQTRVPGKWIYETTAEGRQALVDWLDTPARETSTFRSSVLLRFFFAHRMSPPQLRDLLAEYRRALQAQRDELEAVVDKLTAVPAPAARTGRLAALHGIRTADARLGWIEEVEAVIGEDLP
jgi:DNA-binding PadR family transcriptional regulator